MGTFIYEDRDGRARTQSTESGRIIEQDAITRQALAPKRSRALHNSRIDSENWVMSFQTWGFGTVESSNPDMVICGWIEEDERRLGPDRASERRVVDAMMRRQEEDSKKRNGREGQ